MNCVKLDIEKIISASILIKNMLTLKKLNDFYYHAIPL